jgi:hypothetical protein
MPTSAWLTLTVTVLVSAAEAVPTAVASTAAIIVLMNERIFPPLAAPYAGGPRLLQKRKIQVDKQDDLCPNSTKILHSIDYSQP